ncbi:hypothetical protein QMA77_22125 [Pantoea ananatis]|uniref:hypothetical protein n=1 Tax=Pantoea ananas TaxID=553 RepID=UPI0024ACD03D|nr:hypothetical protein [Pantoea ananatis]MDI6539620.1 hypothetical protein [Pantoea ananatis]
MVDSVSSSGVTGPGPEILTPLSQPPTDQQRPLTQSMQSVTNGHAEMFRQRPHRDEGAALFESEALKGLSESIRALDLKGDRKKIRSLLGILATYSHNLDEPGKEKLDVTIDAFRRLNSAYNKDNKSLLMKLNNSLCELLVKHGEACLKEHVEVVREHCRHAWYHNGSISEYNRHDDEIFKKEFKSCEDVLTGKIKGLTQPEQQLHILATRIGAFNDYCATIPLTLKCHNADPQTPPQEPPAIKEQSPTARPGSPVLTVPNPDGKNVNIYLNGANATAYGGSAVANGPVAGFIPDLKNVVPFLDAVFKGDNVVWKLSLLSKPKTVNAPPKTSPAEIPPPVGHTLVTSYSKTEPLSYRMAEEPAREPLNQHRAIKSGEVHNQQRDLSEPPIPQGGKFIHPALADLLHTIETPKEYSGYNGDLIPELFYRSHPETAIEIGGFNDQGKFTPWHSIDSKFSGPAIQLNLENEHYSPVIDGKLVTVSKDGDCFYASYHYATTGQMPGPDDILRLRMETADFVRKHPEVVIPFLEGSVSQSTDGNGAENQASLSSGKATLSLSNLEDDKGFDKLYDGRTLYTGIRPRSFSSPEVMSQSEQFDSGVLSLPPVQEPREAPLRTQAPGQEPLRTQAPEQEPLRTQAPEQEPLRNQAPQQKPPRTQIPEPEQMLAAGTHAVSATKQAQQNQPFEDPFFHFGPKGYRIKQGKLGTVFPKPDIDTRRPLTLVAQEGDGPDSTGLNSDNSNIQKVSDEEKIKDILRMIKSPADHDGRYSDLLKIFAFYSHPETDIVIWGSDNKGNPVILDTTARHDIFNPHVRLFLHEGYYSPIINGKRIEVNKDANSFFTSYAFAKKQTMPAPDEIRELKKKMADFVRNNARSILHFINNPDNTMGARVPPASSDNVKKDSQKTGDLPKTEASKNRPDAARYESVYVRDPRLFVPKKPEVREQTTSSGNIAFTIGEYVKTDLTPENKPRTAGGPVHLTAPIWDPFSRLKNPGSKSL